MRKRAHGRIRSRLYDSGCGMWRVGNAVVTVNKGRASENDCDGTRRCGDSADAAHRAALNDHMAELTALVLVLE